jgi:regulatory protein
MKITAIRRQKRRSRRLNIHVDGDYRLTLAEEIVIRAGLQDGATIDDELISRLLNQDLELRAKEVALNLLGYRARTRAEIVRRLLRRGFPPTTTEACVQRLVAAGLVDDAEFARAFVQERLRTRPKGSAALKVDLLARGVEEPIAARVIREAFDADPSAELRLARRAAEKFRRRQEEEARSTARRLYGYLARRGFTSTTISTIVAEATADGSMAVDLDD